MPNSFLAYEKARYNLLEVHKPPLSNVIFLLKRNMFRLIERELSWCHQCTLGTIRGWFRAIRAIGMMLVGMESSAS